ncbi:MAG: metal ABC transporter ATP-binding protein [Egibacteraceae bacterium]
MNGPSAHGLSVHGLNVHGLTVNYDGISALRDVSFACAPGEVLGVVGPNGAGKSTLIKAILGLLDVDAGTVAVGGRSASGCRADVAYLPQRSAIDWDFPAEVREVVAMGRYVHNRTLGRLGRRERRLAAVALDQVDMAAFARRQIGELSGGQQQRVLFARALAQHARVYLLDEPFTGVDAMTRKVLEDRIRALAAGGAVVVVVDHDLAGLSDRYDTLLILARRVIACGRPEEVFTGPLLARAYGAVPAPIGALVQGV